MFISQFAALSVFPLASRLYKNSDRDLAVLYHRTVNLIVLIALPLSAGLWLVAPDFIKVVFGDEFTESALILRILAGLLFLNFLSRTFGVFLMSCDQQVARTKSQWTAACVNVLGNLILIPLLGVRGAAVATLISEALLVVLFAVRLRAVLGWPRLSSRLVVSSIGVASFCLPS